MKRAFFKSANEVAAELEMRLKNHEAVAVETVLSTDKYKPFVNSVLNAGGFFGLIYIALNSPRLACERVALRVKQGGHDVPSEKTVDRWHRFLAFDNSE